MIIIEFSENILSGLNQIRYRNVDEFEWSYLDIDIETLHLLLKHFGIISTKRFATRLTKPTICIDNPTTSKTIDINYCGASIQLCCGNDTRCDLRILERNC